MARPIKGRLLICTNSILFDPSDQTEPILKFPLRKCKSVGRWDKPLMSPITGDPMVVETKEYVKLKEGNLVKPYVFVKLDKVAEFRFVPNYTTLSSLLSKASRLFRAHTTQARDRMQIVDAITKEHREAIEFNTSWLEDLSEKILVRVDAESVSPMVSNQGRVVLTDSVLYFQPFNNVDSEPVQKYKVRKVIRVVKRRYLLRQVGLEIFFNNDKIIFFAFHEEADRDRFYTFLTQQTTALIETENQGNMMLMWQKGELSNFDYLMYLNRMADRSFNDLTQYPVFPWIIADYDSETLDLTDPKTFRDLSKPIGALNPDRLTSFKKRYEEMPSPKFLYGTHYSSPGYVLFYTVRSAPEYTLCLQNGKYDHAERMFRSIKDTWLNVVKDSADVKELIPEFYQPRGDFLLNKHRLDLGTTQDSKEKVGDVALPPWASSAEDFTTKCREALECDHVSNNIHNWIDLIFGYKQRGPEAVKADNVFYYITYEGAVDLDRITNPAEREGLQAQIMEFGQTPKQLFTIPHPARRTSLGGLGDGATERDAPSPAPNARIHSTGALIVSASGDAASTLDSDGDALAAGLAAVDMDVAGSSAGAAPAPPKAAPTNWGDVRDFALSGYHKLHKDGITDMAFSADGESMYTVSQDGLLKVFSLSELRQTHSGPVGDMALSSVLATGDSENIVVGSWDNNVYWYNLEYGRVMETLSGHDDAVSCLIKAGDMLITASWDGAVKVWNYTDASTGSRRHADEMMLAEMTELDGEVRCLAYHPGRNLVMAGGAVDGQIVVWSLSDYMVVTTIQAHDDNVNAVAFTPDGQRLISSGNDNTLRVFTVDQGDGVSVFDVDSEICSLICDGQTVLGGCDDGSVVAWDLVQGQPLKSFKKHTAPVTNLVLSKDFTRIITASDDQHIAIWERV